MHSSKADEGDPPGWGLEELGLLTALGFGPDSLLMSEPKLFVDAPFLAALQVEFTEELGERDARAALFQIGMIHGLRDAIRIGTAPTSDARTSAVCPPLAMRFGIHRTEDGSLVMPGTWPDAYEAEARLAKLG